VRFLKVFIAGPRVLKTLSVDVEKRIDNIISQDITVLVGDANGVDKMVQQYLNSRTYRNAIVYASNGVARNNIGNWDVQNAPVLDGAKGFDFYATKDKLMAEDADYGFMIWNGKSKGTLNNIINLTKQAKTVLVYFTPHKKFYSIKSMDAAKELATACGDDIGQLFSSLTGSTVAMPKIYNDQLSLYHGVI